MTSQPLCQVGFGPEDGCGEVDLTAEPVPSEGVVNPGGEGLGGMLGWVVDARATQGPVGAAISRVVDVAPPFRNGATR